MKQLLTLLGSALLAVFAAFPAALAQPTIFGPPPTSVARPAQPAPTPSASGLVGSLDADSWRTYRARFVTEEGRIVDTANGNISHSEGQGYGLILAVAAGDRIAFEAIWGWTRANLLVRGDELFAWRWEPNKRPGVGDMNNATDGDILIAWALVEAAESWNDPTYRVAARRIATDVGRRSILFKGLRDPLILPGVGGFAAADRPDGPVVNLSYWVFPAFPRLSVVAPEFDWDRVAATGLDLLAKARFGPSRLPTEWISLASGTPRPADGFPPVFSYNAIRIPLYLLWAGQTRPDLLEPFVALWGKRERSGLPVVDTTNGQVAQWLDESGYASLASLLGCAVAETEPPSSFFQVRTNENYYPVTLHLMARIVAKLRYPRCVAG